MNNAEHFLIGFLGAGVAVCCWVNHHLQKPPAVDFYEFLCRVCKKPFLCPAKKRSLVRTVLRDGGTEPEYICFECEAV